MQTHRLPKLTLVAPRAPEREPHAGAKVVALRSRRTARPEHTETTHRARTLDPTRPDAA